MLLEILTELPFFRMIYAAGKKIKKRRKETTAPARGMRFIMISFERKRKEKKRESN